MHPLPIWYYMNPCVNLCNSNKQHLILVEFSSKMHHL